MNVWRIFAAIVLATGALTLGGGTVAAQSDRTFDFPDSPVNTTGSLTVVSEPSGAVITLRGRQLKVAGRTPWSVSRGLEGPYIVTADLPGYEEWERTIYVDPMARDTLRVKLSPKTRLKATARSMLIPGWGQRYSDHAGRAWTFLVGEIVAGGVWAVFEHRYRGRRDDLQIAHDNYAAATQVDEQARLWLDVQKQFKRADDAADDRDITAAVVGGVYVLNVLDAFFSFPERRFATFAEADGVTPGMSFASADPEHVRFGVKYRF